LAIMNKAASVRPGVALSVERQLPVIAAQGVILGNVRKGRRKALLLSDVNEQTMRVLELGVHTVLPSLDGEGGPARRLGKCFGAGRLSGWASALVSDRRGGRVDASRRPAMTAEITGAGVNAI
jgi:hypothetical protein